VKIEVHLLTHDDEQMIEWSLRHYLAFADEIVVHDGGPAGKSGLICCGFYPAIEARPWDTAGELNDALARDLKNSCWQGSDADWVIVADADELVWARDLRGLLESRLAAGAAILRPHGFEMFSDTWHEASEFPGMQITELAPSGAPDDQWYAKPVVFSPRLVVDSGFGIGAHESDPVLRNGRRFHVGRDWPCCEGLTLLHYKSIFGGLDRIAKRYDATRERLALVNVRNGWGNFKPGIEHAREKRDLLLPHVRRVVV
jgi:hypothetical protein